MGLHAPTRVGGFQQGISFSYQGPKKARAYKIECSRCPQTDHIQFATRNGTMADEVIKKKFAERGWDIGKKRQDDVCPHCLDLDRRQRQLQAERHRKAKEEAAQRLEAIRVAVAATAKERAKTLLERYPLPTVSRELASMRAGIEECALDQATLEAVVMTLIDSMSEGQRKLNTLTDKFVERLLGGDSSFFEKPHSERSFKNIGKGKPLAPGQRIRFEGKVASISYQPEHKRFSVRLSDDLVKLTMAEDKRADVVLLDGEFDGCVGLVFVEDGNKIHNVEAANFHQYTFHGIGEDHDVPAGNTRCPYEIVRDESGAIEGIALRYRNRSEECPIDG